MAKKGRLTPLGIVLELVFIMIVLPVTCFFLAKLLGTRELMEMVIDMVGEIQIFDKMMDITSILYKGHDPSLAGNSELYLEHVAELLNSLGPSMLQLFSITLCVRLCVMICDLAPWGSMLMAPRLAGVIFGSIILKVYDFPMVALGFLILLFFVIDLIFVQDISFDPLTLFIKYLLYCLKMTIELLGVVFTTGFIAVLLVIWQGNITSIGMAIFMVVIFSLPLICVALLERCVSPKKSILPL